MPQPSRQRAIGEVGFALQRYQRSTQAFDDAVGRSLGLGPADMRCLDWLTSGPLTPGEIAVATGLRPAATTALVDRLSTKGFVRRIPSDDDRRRVRVELTETGRRRIDAIYGPLVVEGVDLFDDVTVDELDTMRRLLERMTALTERHRDRMQE